MNRKRRYYFGKRKPVKKPAEQLSEEEREEDSEGISPSIRSPCSVKPHKEPGKK